MSKSGTSIVGPTSSHCQKLLDITRFPYIEVLFHIFCYYWGEENRSLYLRTSLYRETFVISRFTKGTLENCFKKVDRRKNRQKAMGPSSD